MTELETKLAEAMRTIVDYGHDGECGYQPETPDDCDCARRVAKRALAVYDAAKAESTAAAIRTRGDKP